MHRTTCSVQPSIWAVVGWRIIKTLGHNEWEILPLDEEGEPRSIFEGMLGELPDGAEVAKRKEAEEELRRQKGIIAAHLDGDVVAKRVLGCLCDGVVKRQEIATKLGIDVSGVTAARKRLDRKLWALGRSGAGCSRRLIEELRRI